MSLQLWRCHHPDCPGDPDDPTQPVRFEAEHGVCPACGADVRKPEHKSVIALLARVHLLVKDPKGPLAGQGYRYRIACDAGARNTGGRGTGEPGATTCPQCQAMPEFKRLAAENGFEGHAPRVLDAPGE